MYILDRITCEEFQTFLDESSVFVLPEEDAEFEFEFDMNAKRFPYFLKDAFFEVLQECSQRNSDAVPAEAGIHQELY